MYDGDRDDALAWAADVLDRGQEVLFLDTETTGLDGNAEIVDIAVLDGHGKVHLDTLVKPVRSIPQAATAVHRIDDRMVASAPSWPFVYPRLMNLLADCPFVVVYNAAFDRRILDQVNRQHGFFETRGEWHCAMLKYAAYVGEWNLRHNGYRWHKLEVAARRLGVSSGSQNHRALDDARLCRAVVTSLGFMVKPPLPPAKWWLGPDGDPWDYDLWLHDRSGHHGTENGRSEARNQLDDEWWDLILEEIELSADTGGEINVRPSLQDTPELFQSRLDALERLATFWSNGVLDDDEFTHAKRRLLGMS